MRNEEQRERDLQQRNRIQVIERNVDTSESCLMLTSFRRQASNVYDAPSRL
jgi:hypothetical protein